jgi:hypothetical protein
LVFSDMQRRLSYVPLMPGSVIHTRNQVHCSALQRTAPPTGFSNVESLVLLTLPIRSTVCIAA